MKQLTFDGVNDLFQHPRWGAVTLEHAKYLDALRAKPTPALPRIIPTSAELEARNERCIEEHGCGMF
jgi:hypothetical protein